MGDWYLGEIRLFSMAWNPEYWLLCDGSLLQIQGNQALYSLLGTAFGGNGTTTFGLPDLRGRTPIAASVVSATYLRGVAGGSEAVQLTTAQIPTHTHAFKAASAVGTTTALAANGFIGSATTAPPAFPTAPNTYAPLVATQTMVALNPGTLSPGGGGVGHPNIQPSLVLNFCIARAGTYPPRN